jgi:hypothetical protein
MVEASLEAGHGHHEGEQGGRLRRHLRRKASLTTALALSDEQRVESAWVRVAGTGWSVWRCNVGNTD